ncbi:baseplate wedge subunit [Synechococcus phage S-SSM4]|uniref:Baseplate wedge subunit n=1 Tax=Synechococcus phage S-SSM4 TaxID=536466 RepID=M1UFX9_9CAUD|nr:baseplate wedge subunit [Synechococcus phage S-SSM4]AGG54122.1 baseplate wedge subunit [Synechococcus phage S-SSM4]
MDFNSIKASIKDYLRTRPEFTDFDFEGATLSYLIDVLAYNTYYSAFNANMAVNEAFLSSATIRDNVVSIAKLLNYTPRSSRAAKACLSFTAQSQLFNDVYPQYVTLRRGIVATGGEYNFVVLDDVNANTDANGLASFNKIVVYEGTILTYRYTVSTFKKQKYLIPTDKVDTSTLRVTVKPNAQSTQEDVYVLGEDITQISATSRVYFLTETEDARYELTFGDDVIGKKLEDGEVINISYVKTHEADANDINEFEFVGDLVDQYGRPISDIEGDLFVNERSQLGDGPEAVESIKFTAPRDYTTQLRAVTAQDYSIITKKVYSNAESVIAFGGDELSPPVYGKVYVAVKTKTGNLLNNATKLQIAKDLRKYSMASIEPVIIDPEFLYIPTSLFVFYDPTKTSKSIAELQGLVLGAIEQFAGQEDINNFGSTFSLSKYNKAIGLADTAIDSASVQTTLLRYLTVNADTVDTYCTDFGSPIYDSNPSNDGGDSGDGSSGGNGGNGGDGNGGVCYKEPVIKSGQFVTTDRPTVIQYFEDDGFGNLRTYYNSGSSKIYTNNGAGTVDYSTGKICFGPVSISDPTSVIPVQIIPTNVSNIKPATPGTIVSLPIPSITVVPIGTQPPSTIPLNNLTPEQYAVVPATITPIDVGNTGDLNNIACF